MRAKAEAAGTDLLLVDTGDRVEGNGLYDSSDPQGQYVFNIVAEQDIDVLCSGNHELYKKSSAENEYFKSVPNFKGNYLASNIDIQDPESGEFVPLAKRYKKFETKVQGIRVMAFGFLFDFTRNWNNTIVQPVEDTVKEEWFQEAIRDKEVDLFLIAGHVAARSKEWDAIHKAIRKVNWDTPIQFFAGHYHIRDYVKYDSKSYAMASGRFMETIGFASIDGLTTKHKSELSTKIPTFTRRYIDSNLYSFQHHTNLTAEEFETEHGKNVTAQLASAREILDLDKTYGCAPKDYWMARTPASSNDSIFHLLETQVLPAAVVNSTRADNPRLIITNTGAIRFDVFKGPFTRDATFIVAPFTSGFRYIPDVDYDKAKKILTILNHGGTILQTAGNDLEVDAELLAQAETEMPPVWELRSPDQIPQSQLINADVVATQHSVHDQTPLAPAKDDSPDPKLPLTPGYTTHDDAGTTGDDTLHSPIKFYNVPNCIQASSFDAASTTTPEKVDLVYIDFVEPWIAIAGRLVGVDKSVLEKREWYLEKEVTLAKVLEEWVGENWKCES